MRGNVRSPRVRGSAINTTKPSALKVTVTINVTAEIVVEESDQRKQILLELNVEIRGPPWLVWLSGWRAGLRT